MNRNTVHNFNILIKNNSSLESSEDLTKSFIKEFAQVSKEINEQKDIVQIWQEQNASNNVVNNTLDSAGEGVFDTNAAIKTVPSFSNTSSASGSNLFPGSTLNASIGGGAFDSTESTSMSSFGSTGNTLPVSEAENTVLSNAFSQIYESIDTKQMLIVPQMLQSNNNEPSMELIKAEIKKKLDQAIKENNPEAIQYWTRISKAFEEGAIAVDFIDKPNEILFTEMYFALQKWHLPVIGESEFNNVNWEDVKELMILKLLELSKENEDSRIKAYYKRLISEIKRSDIDINKLFSEHDELFILLKSVFPQLPSKITIQTRKEIYPNLSPKKVYPDIGVQSIYYIWSETLLDEVEIKYAQGEKRRNKEKKYPKLKEGQWYDFDRIDYPDKSGSTFWNASIYNTMNAQHYLYNTIAQRHAYYKFVDAYLKTKGIISEWFDAAARVTMGSIASAIDGEIALGSAEMMNLWYLSDKSDEFLKGGNKYLFAENMNNVKLLLEGKGRLSGEFIDAKGNKQSFKNLTKQELDFKLVEFEQTMVQDYINSSFQDLDINLMKKTLSEAGVTGNDELDEIVAEINENFTLWMAPDLTQDIMEKYFTVDGKITFNFAKYDDRVKLGQVMVKELYYLKLSDTFKAESLDKIIKKPQNYNAETEEYFIINQENAVKEQVKHLKEYKILERLERIKANIDKGAINSKGFNKVKDDVKKSINEEIKKSINAIKGQIKKSLSDIGDEVSEVAITIDSILYNDLKELYEYLKKELEITESKKNGNQDYTDLVENLFNDMSEIHEISEKLRKKIAKEIQKTVEVVKEEGKGLPDKIAVNALVKTAEHIYPGVGKLRDGKKKISFEKSYEETVAILLYEFAMGEGPEIRNFDYHQHKFAQQLLKGRMMEEIMDETLKLLRQTNYDFENKPDSKDLKIDLEFSPTFEYAIESIDKHLNSNLAQIFIGGAFALVHIRNKKIEGYVFNQTGRRSFILHIAGDIERNNEGGKEAKLSTIKQRIYFTFELP
ncbi:hypothetical protein SAMN02927916_1833 [Flavobacterium anhuiense]|uniref:Uncharacterized protein n=1 Tax=Flavobacterium anhuiense TaxID=459526 RepID=A0ABY0LLB1_9FLAO|nr:hypothetical protein [Flavobacterium anhuiense]SCY31515.1 hypothetical protein SAMN02927916_1833 [Flavobacterium anhuiense]